MTSFFAKSTKVEHNFLTIITYNDYNNDVKVTVSMLIV